MLSLFDVGTPEEAHAFYEGLGADLTPEEAFTLWGRFRHIFSRDVAYCEREAEYSRYCEIIKAVQNGDKSRLHSEWEKPAQ